MYHLTGAAHDARTKVEHPRSGGGKPLPGEPHAHDRAALVDRLDVAAARDHAVGQRQEVEPRMGGDHQVAADVIATLQQGQRVGGLCRTTQHDAGAWAAGADGRTKLSAGVGLPQDAQRAGLLLPAQRPKGRPAER